MPAIDIQDLHYAYPPLEGTERHWVLRGVTLAVEAGACVGVMGPTGAGKSTLCQAMMGIVPRLTGGTIRGKVQMLGRDVRGRPVPDTARSVGIVLQETGSQLFNLTVEEEVAFGLENMGLPSQAIGQRVTWALETVGLKAARGRSPFELSGGEQQRLAIAATLAMSPDVLILDEPTAHLDPRGKREIQSLIETLAHQSGRTVVVVEQDVDWLAELVDRVVVLADGRIAMDDAPETVFGSPDRLLDLGVGPPQLSELAAGLSQDLGTHFEFIRMDQAERQLTEDLRGES